MRTLLPLLFLLAACAPTRSTPGGGDPPPDDGDGLPQLNFGWSFGMCGGECVGECSANHDLCARFGLYGAYCLEDAERCWWLADASTPARGATCNSLCERIGLRCDPDVGFPDGYSGVLERCYGSPGCYAADQRRLCATPTRSGETSRLACTCVR